MGRTLNIPESLRPLVVRAAESLSWSGQRVLSAVQEYVVFMQLKKALGDYDATRLSAPPMIEIIWRLHILDTRG